MTYGNGGRFWFSWELGHGWISVGIVWPGFLELGKGFLSGGTEFSGIGRPLGRLGRISDDDKYEGRVVALQVVFSGLLDQPLDQQRFLASSIFTEVSSLPMTRTGHHGNLNVPRLECQTQL